MYGFFRSIRRCVIFWLVFIPAATLWPVFAASTDAAEGSPVSGGRIVVIDPGHGGSDAGAHGPTGALEKDVALRFAEMLAGKLPDEYRAVLTRTGDYGVSLYERTATANGRNADLFISIHTGAGFSTSCSGINLYYFADTRPTGLPSLSSEAPGPSPTPWERIQAAHADAAAGLAETLSTDLGAATGARVGIFRADLAVLAGADMPGLLMEIGCLTHPADERNLLDGDYLEKAAAAVAKGIVKWLSGRP